MLKLTTDKHEASRGLSATAELLIVPIVVKFSSSEWNFWLFWRQAHYNIVKFSTR